MKSYKIYLSSSIMGLSNEKFLCETMNKGAITRLITEELANLGYRKADYWRYTDLGTMVSIDFGSWSKFIVVDGLTFADLMTM